MKSTKPRLSVCMIVRNEAHQLRDCLNSILHVADEIVVVDTGSTDDTRAIAREFTSNVFEIPWEDDFSKARNASLERAGGQYFLWMDADDRLDEDNAAKAARLKDFFNERRAYHFVLQDVRGCIPGHSYHQLRCAPLHPAIRFNGRIHESLTDSLSALDIPTGTTDVVVEHHGYSDPKLLKAKIHRNIRILQSEIAQGRDDHQVHYFLAMAHDYQGNAQEALRSMEKALALLERNRFVSQSAPRQSSDPFIVEAVLFLAEHACRLSLQDLAKRYMSKAEAWLEMPEPDPHDLQRLGCLLQRLGRHQEAIRRLEQALSLPPKVGFCPRPPFSRTSVLAHLAFSHLALGRFDQVEHCVSRAVTQGAEVGNVWQSLGQMAMSMGKADLAELSYDKARAMGSLSADALCNWGLLESKKGRYQSARSAYRQVIGMAPDHRESLANCAFLELMTGNAPDARELYDRLLALGECDLEAITARGYLAVCERDPGGARQVTSRLRLTLKQGDPNDVEAADVYDPVDAHLWSLLAGRFVETGKPRLAQWAQQVEGFLKQLA